MAGHSKWHNIRLRKAAQDAGKAKVFAKLAREIIVAARHGGGDPDGNPRLRLAIERARDASMPNDNIQRAINRGTGGVEGANYEEAVFEGYGPGGVALYIQAATDNRNRTVADLRHTLSKYGGSLGEAGCVAWLFERKGIVTVDGTGLNEDRLMEQALEAGADDVTQQDGMYEVITSYDSLERVKTALATNGFHMTRAEHTMLPKSTVPLSGEQAERTIRLMSALEDLDDVQQVSANFDIAEELLEVSG